MSEELKPVKLHNRLAEAKYTLNTSEEKLFIYAIKNLNQDNNKFIESKFNLSDFANYAGLDLKNLYKDIEKMTDNIMQTILYVKDEKYPDKWTKYNLTQKCTYDSGLITFKFNKDMESMLLQLQHHYFYQFPSVMKFKSWYSIRIYNYLKSRSYKGNNVEVSVEDFRIMLGIENKYARFSNLKSRIIGPSIKEINDEYINCDIRIDDCEVLYYRNSPTTIIFTITRKDSEITEFLDENYNIAKMKQVIGLEDESFNSIQIMEFYELAIKVFTTYESEDELFLYMKLNFKYTKEKKKVGNAAAYFKKALKNDYAKAIPQIKTGYIVE